MDTDSKMKASVTQCDRLVRDIEVAELLGISSRQVWRLSSGGLLSQPVRLGGVTRWRLSDVQALVSGSTAR